jgi:hypothetical protein
VKAYEAFWNHCGVAQPPSCFEVAPPIFHFVFMVKHTYHY